MSRIVGSRPIIPKRRPQAAPVVKTYPIPMANPLRAERVEDRPLLLSSEVRNPTPTSMVDTATRIT